MTSPDSQPRSSTRRCVKYAQFIHAIRRNPQSRHQRQLRRVPHSVPESTASDRSSPLGSEPDWRHSSSYGSSRDSYPGDDYFIGKYYVDEFMNLGETNSLYIRYRIAGGKMKMRENDTGAEAHYKQWPGIELIEGNWGTDYNNLAPCKWMNSDPAYD